MLLEGHGVKYLGLYLSSIYISKSILNSCLAWSHNDATLGVYTFYQCRSKKKSGHRLWNCGKVETAGYSSGSKSSRVIIVKFFASWVSGELVGFWRFSTVVSWTVLVLRHKTKTETMRVKTDTKTKSVTLKTKRVKILPRDEAMPGCFPSLLLSIVTLVI